MCIYAATDEVSVLLETSEPSSIFLPNTLSIMQALNWNEINDANVLQSDITE